MLDGKATKIHLPRIDENRDDATYTNKLHMHRHGCHPYLLRIYEQICWRGLDQTYDICHQTKT